MYTTTLHSAFLLTIINTTSVKQKVSVENKKIAWENWLLKEDAEDQKYTQNWTDREVKEEKMSCEKVNVEKWIVT